MDVSVGADRSNSRVKREAKRVNGYKWRGGSGVRLGAGQYTFGDDGIYRSRFRIHANAVRLLGDIGVYHSWDWRRTRALNRLKRLVEAPRRLLVLRLDVLK